MQKMWVCLVMVAAMLVVAAPNAVDAFGGGVNQGSKSNIVPKLKKDQARQLAKLGHSALVKKIDKAKKPKEIKALMAQALKILKEHAAKAKAAAQKAAKEAKAKGKKKGVFGK